MAETVRSTDPTDSAETANTTEFKVPTASANSAHAAESEAPNAEVRRNLSAFKSDGTPDYIARMHAYEKISADYKAWRESRSTSKAPKEENPATDVPTYCGRTRVYRTGGRPGCAPNEVSVANARMWKYMQTEKGKAEQAAFEAKHGTFDDWFKTLSDNLEDIRKIHEKAENDPQFAEHRAWEKSVMTTPTWLSVKPEQLDPNLHPKDRMYKPNFTQKLQMGGYDYWLWKKEQDEAAAAAEAEQKNKAKTSKGKGKR